MKGMYSLANMEKKNTYLLHWIKPMIPQMGSRISKALGMHRENPPFDSVSMNYPFVNWIILLCSSNILCKVHLLISARCSSKFFILHTKNSWREYIVHTTSFLLLRVILQLTAVLYPSHAQPIQAVA